MSNNEVNVEQAHEILRTMMSTDIVPFLWGAPGIGKSSIVKQLASELEWDIIDLRLSLLNPVDLRGLPIVDKKSHTSEWLKPGFLPTDSDKKPGILFLDEINLAHQSVQAAAYQLILDKKLGEYHFPKHWKIVAAGNREIDKANVYKISAPLANRFIHLNVIEDWKIWKKWAKNNGIRSEITNFIILRPNLFLQMPENNQKAFPSPRSWSFLSDTLNAFNYTGGEPSEILMSVISGTIGDGPGKEFGAWLAEFNLRDIEKLVEKFYETGSITLPKEQSVRYGIVRKVFQDYVDKTITVATLEKFKSHLEPEESEIVAQLEVKHQKAISAKNAI